MVDTSNLSQKNLASEKKDRFRIETSVALRDQQHFEDIPPIAETVDGVQNPAPIGIPIGIPMKHYR